MKLSITSGMGCIVITMAITVALACLVIAIVLIIMGVTGVALAEIIADIGAYNWTP